MVVLLALVGALTVGLVLGLMWRGLVMIGDRRQLGIMSEQMQVEHRMSQATNEAITRMRQIARDQLPTSRPE